MVLPAIVVSVTWVGAATIVMKTWTIIVSAMAVSTVVAKMPRLTMSAYVNKAGAANFVTRISLMAA
jgi:hypothetical protein